MPEIATQQNPDRNRSGLYEPECRALLDKAYVSLTEAVTWIAVGDSRDDDYISQKIMETAKANLAKWRDADGPEWMRPYLELFRQEKSLDSISEYSDVDVAVAADELEEIKQWLEERELSVEEAYREVMAWCEEDERRETLTAQAHELIWQACVAQEITLLGVEWDQINRRAVSGTHEQIPFTFFLRPVVHFIGNRFAGKIELAPEPPPDTMEDLWRYTQERPDRRVDYALVLIRREDVLMLAERHRHGQGTAEPTRPTRRFSPAEAERWYQNYVARWRPSDPSPSERDDHNQARMIFPGISRDFVRRLRQRFAPPEWKRRGRRRGKMRGK